MSEREALDIIESYLERVKANLPEGVDRDIIEELRQHILEMVKERGGLTVENARWAINRMGDPEVLADEIAKEEGLERRKKRFEISVKWGDKTYNWGFEINEDILEILRLVVFGVIVWIIFASTASFIYALTNVSSESAFVSLLTGLLELVVALFAILLATWFLSIIYGENTKKPIVKRVVERRKSLTREFVSYAKIGFYMFVGVIQYLVGITIGWFLFVYATKFLELTMVTLALGASIAIALLYGGTLSFGQAIYLSMTGRDSLRINYAKSFAAIIVIPGLILVNLFPEQLQIPILKMTQIELEEPWGIFKYITLVKAPPESYILIQLMAIMFVIIILLYVVVKTTFYLREKRIYNLVYSR